MRKFLLAGFAAAIVALSGCGQMSRTAAPEEAIRPSRTESDVPDCAAQPGGPDPVVTAGATTYPETDKMASVLEGIRQAGESTFRDVFAGLEVVPERGYAIVYRVPSAEFDAVIRQVAGDQCVVVRTAAHTHAQLSALQNQISEDLNFWKKRNINISTISSRHDGSGVVVGTLDVARAQVELPKHYGTGIPIIIERTGPVVPLRRG